MMIPIIKNDLQGLKGPFLAALHAKASRVLHKYFTKQIAVAADMYAA